MKHHFRQAKIIPPKIKTVISGIVDFTWVHEKKNATSHCCDKVLTWSIFKEKSSICLTFQKAQPSVKWEVWQLHQ